MTKQAEISFPVGVDLQKMRDDLVVLRDALTAQIAAMDASGRVCTHHAADLVMDTLHGNGPHGKSWVLCRGCNCWVPFRRE